MVYHRQFAIIFRALFLASILMLSTACGTNTATPKGTVQVLYAGSLVNLMEHTIGPNFTSATGYGYAGEGKGSGQLVNEIKGKLRAPDIFISADPSINSQLMGDANGNYASWYISFASTPLVIGYNPQSAFAADFQAAAQGTKNWYDVLREPGLRLGRTDPELDPKGYKTIMAMELAQNYYHLPNFEQTILGSAGNPAQIFPEEQLVARLTAGQLDAGFFYRSETIDAHIAYISLPNQIDLSDPALAATYAQVVYTTAKGKVLKGSPTVFTIAIVSTSKTPSGADAFVKYFLSSTVQHTLQQHGFTVLAPQFSGSRSGVPSDILALVP